MSCGAWKREDIKQSKSLETGKEKENESKESQMRVNRREGNQINRKERCF